MTTPTGQSYLAACRRFWYVPVLAALVALGVSTALPASQPDRVTFGEIVFTIQTGEAGQVSEGEARLQEGDLAARRLNAYAIVVARSEDVVAALEAANVEVPEPTILNGVTRADNRLLITADSSGRMTVRFEDQDLSGEASLDLVAEIQQILAREVPALDGQQVQPSIVDVPLVIPPRAGLLEAPAEPGLVRDVVLPLGVGFVLGLGLVYLLDWRYRRVEGRSDLEERLQVGVLGEAVGRPGDFEALALTLGRFADSRGAVLLAAAPGGRDPEPVAEGICGASRLPELAHVHFSAEEATGGGGPSDPAGGSSGPAELNIVDLTATRGVHPALVTQAPSADVVAILVEYGRTPMRDLESMLIRLSDVSDTPLRAIGIGRI